MKKFAGDFGFNKNFLSFLNKNQLTDSSVNNNCDRLARKRPTWLPT